MAPEWKMSTAEAPESGKYVHIIKRVAVIECMEWDRGDVRKRPIRANQSWNHVDGDFYQESLWSPVGCIVSDPGRTCVTVNAHTFGVM